MHDNMKIAVIGGGAAGMMCAGVASEYGADVWLFEHTDRLGKKLAITGKGRCNVTNLSPISALMENIPRNPRFLYSAFNAFSPEDTMSLFERLGVELKVERGNRVFPASDKAADIVNALRRYCSGINIVYEKVRSVKKIENGDFLLLADKEYTFDRVVIATGGKSYPRTGSDGSGYKLAIKLGHTVTSLSPSLIPIESESRLCKDMQGLSLKNVSVKVIDKSGKCIYSDFGELMFTHFGLTGPVVLSASAHLNAEDISDLSMVIDLKPALDEKTLENRLLSDFSKNANKDYINSLGDLLPTKMIEPFVRYTCIDPRKKVNLITKEERHSILCALKEFTVPLHALRPIEEAIITRGGIDVKEISPKNMESKIVDGLYFAGEVIDTDGYTGGFNLQIAFSTGYLAGKSSAGY